MREARWSRWWWSSCTVLVLSGCLILPGSGRTWYLGIDTYGKTDPFYMPYSPALAVGREAEMEVYFRPDGCKVEMAYIGNGEFCLDLLAGHKADRKVRATTSDTAPPFSATISGNKVRLRAVADGEAKVKFAARNRDGKVLDAVVPLRAATAARLSAEVRRVEAGKTVVGCLDGRKPSRLLFEAGKPFTFAYTLLSRDEPTPFVILGVPVKVAARGSAGFSQSSYREISTSRNVPVAAEGTYVMTEPGTFELTSATMPAFKLTGGVYRCQDLTALAVRDLVRTEREASFDLAPMVGDDPVCARLSGCPVEAKVETPDVCVAVQSNGDFGPKVFDKRQKLVKRSAGTCRVTAKIAGTSLEAKLEVEFTEPPPAAKSGS